MADEKTKYQVLSPLKHSGKLYMPADGKTVSVSLTSEEADQLKALGVVGDMPAKSEKTTDTKDTK